MQQLTRISKMAPPNVTKVLPFWNQIYRFALSAWFLGALSLALAAGGLMSGCSSGGSGGGSSDTADNAVVTSLSQYVLPGEISAVPASKEENLQTTSVTSKKTVTISKLGRSSLSTLAAAYSAAGTDYTLTKANKFVEEPALEQFSVLEDVLTALNQTKYYDNIGQPAYKAMVTMVGGEDGQERKSLEAWVVESDILDASGNVVEPQNAAEGVDYDIRVRAWIEEEGNIIKGQFVVTDPPSQDEDGAYTDYGTWTLNVSFVDGGAQFFTAHCSVNAQGQSVIEIHSKEGPDGAGSGGTSETMVEMKAIMVRSEDEGYGKVSYPDWDAMWNEGFDPASGIPHNTAQYAYNTTYLALQENDDEIVYKDRTEVVEMTHRYGVFRYDNGNDVMREKEFGFPFWYEVGGERKHGYYGAWQGRHQLWVDGEGGMPAAGTVVTREDHGSDTDAQTYTIGESFDGTLTKRDYVTASLDDIKNIPVEIWVNKNFQLLWDTNAWKLCKDLNWSSYPPTCNHTPIDFGSEIGFETLVVGANDNRKDVYIDGWDDVNSTNKQFVYLMENTIGTHSAGFYEAEQNQTTWRMEALEPLVAINPSEVTNLWVYIGGSLYVEYKGEPTGWVEKEVIGFDEMAWMPEFGTNDKPYKLPSNNELYINMEGATYVVQKNDSGVVSVKLELQTTLNPENAATLMPEGTILRDPWDIDEVNSTYKFVTSTADPTKYLMLVYASIGQNDKDQDQSPLHSVGDVVTTGMWGLVNDSGVGFNWEYSSQENGGWGSVTYLMDGDQYLLLDDPVRFTAFDFEYTVDGTTVTKTLGLQYDGWMMGLPDLYWELERNSWTMTDDIKNKIINLPAGTELDSVDGIKYVLKPLEISQFLMPVDAGTSGLPDISAADSVDLETVPGFDDHEMGDMPANTTVLYSEGIAVD